MLPLRDVSGMNDDDNNNNNTKYTEVCILLSSKAKPHVRVHSGHLSESYLSRSILKHHVYIIYYSACE